MLAPHDSNLAPTGRSALMRRLRRDARTIAPLDAHVLLQGETGTGKGRTARWLHALSPRAGRPFVHVDCAALSETLIESELFGHERGAFTSADVRHVGRFERAGTGTVFLDEIADLSPRMQAKLLRVLEDREYERVGGSQTLRMDARVIAASSTPLSPDASATKRPFRPDLYFRLSVFQLSLPPLRARLDDIPELVDLALERGAGLGGGSRRRVTPEFLDALSGHDWPGNVRELLNVIERAALHAHGRSLGAADAERALEALRCEPPPDAIDGASGRSLPEAIAHFERQQIAAALRRARGNVSRAARALGIPRGTLRHKLEKLAIAPRAQADEGAAERGLELRSARETS